MARPGIMLYFDILEPIKVLPDADKGRLLVAMLEYGQSGIVPEFEGMLALAWGFVKPKLDRDGETYENAKVQRKYAAFCKQRTTLNLPKVPFEEWLEMSEDERKRMLTTDNEPLRAVDFGVPRYPSATASSPTPTSSSTAITSAAAATTPTTEPEFAAAAAQRNVKVIGGNLGKNVVFLSEQQIEDMLEKMGLDTFDYYVDKLSSFIIKNDAHVKNHYETILQWWEQDGAIRRS